MDSDYTCKTFSISLPENVDTADLASLLRHFANQIDKTEMQNVLDITFENSIDSASSNTVYAFTIYYR